MNTALYYYIVLHVIDTAMKQTILNKTTVNNHIKFTYEHHKRLIICSQHWFCVLLRQALTNGSLVIP